MSQMVRRVINRYFRDIVGALNECEIQFQKDPRIGRRVVGGWCQDDIITLRDRPERENLLLSLIHEALHHAYPELPEHGCDGDSSGEACDLLSRQLLCNFSTNQLKRLERYLRH